MFAGSSKPKTASVAPVPLPQAASSTPAPVALPAVSAVVSTPVVSTPVVSIPAASSSTLSTGTTILPVAEPSETVLTEQAAGKADKPQTAVPAPLPAIAKVVPDAVKQGSIQAERDAREAARKRQIERELLAKQKELDKAAMNKANRTLDDLLK